MSRTAELVVGIDLGTTDTKAVLTTPDGTTVGFARGATSWTQREGGRLETTGAALTGDVIATVSEALGDNHRRKHPRLPFCGVDEPGARGCGPLRRLCRARRRRRRTGPSVCRYRGPTRNRCPIRPCAGPIHQGVTR